MKKYNAMDPVEVYAGSIMQAEIVTVLLGNAGIESFLKDDISGTLMPWVTSPGGAEAVTVFVAGADYEEARSVIKEFENNSSQKD